MCSFEDTRIKRKYLHKLKASVIIIENYSSLAQSVEHAAVNRSVVGSSPTGGVFSLYKRNILFMAPWSSGQDIALSRR